MLNRKKERSKNKNRINCWFILIEQHNNIMLPGVLKHYFPTRLFDIYLYEKIL
jgi:hypothetical protein